MQEPLDEIVLYLPHGVLDISSASNRIRVVPQDVDFGLDIFLLKVSIPGG